MGTHSQSCGRDTQYVGHQAWWLLPMCFWRYHACCQHGPPPCQVSSTATSWGRLYHQHTPPVGKRRLRDQEPQTGISPSNLCASQIVTHSLRPQLCRGYTSPPLLFFIGVHGMASGTPLYRWVYWGPARRKDGFKAMA